MPDKILHTIDAETLMAQPFEKTMFIVDGIIPQGISIIGGTSKIGKSWLMLQLGLVVSKGQSFWEIPTEKCTVLYLCLEDTFGRIQNRLYRLTDDPPDNFHFAVISGSIGNGLEEELEEFLQSHKDTKLIIIDTFQKVRNSKKNSNSGMYAEDYCDISSIKYIADEWKIAIIIVHHIRKIKDSEDPFNEISGSTGITGAVDTAFILKRENASSKNAVLIAKGRDIEMQEIRLCFENRIWTLVERKAQEEMQKEDIPAFLFRLVEFIKSKNQWSGTATELVEEMGETEVSPNAVTKFIGRFYYDVFKPEGIVYKTKRTNSKRIINLKISDGYDESDGENGIEKNPSQPSPVVTKAKGGDAA